MRKLQLWYGLSESTVQAGFFDFGQALAFAFKGKSCVCMPSLRKIHGQLSKMQHQAF
jgi:hypothetical protein